MQDMRISVIHLELHKINFWGVQERSNDWKYVVPCKSINKDTQMLLILSCKNAFMGYYFCVKW